jgi:hypothetical protein
MTTAPCDKSKCTRSPALAPGAATTRDTLARRIGIPKFSGSLLSCLSQPASAEGMGARSGRDASNRCTGVVQANTMQSCEQLDGGMVSLMQA